MVQYYNVTVVWNATSCSLVHRYGKLIGTAQRWRQQVRPKRQYVST